MLRIVKTANPKSKIQKYQITDPALKLFIYKYEDLVPWDQMRHQDDIENFIHGHLVRKLHGLIRPDSEDNIYMKPEDINIEEEFQNNPNDPHLQEAIRIYRQNPQEATQKIVGFINEEKQQGFMQWWTHLTQEKPEYADSPAFVYSVFKPITDSSPASQKNGPPPLEPKALEQVWMEITEQGSTQMNVLKTYKQQANRLDRIGAKTIKSPGKGEWIRIDGQPRDSKNFRENVRKLTRYSQGQGWCTGYGMADPYLRLGDFWLYIEDNRPEVAIRLDGNMVAEIRGRFNDPERLRPYWREVDHFLTQGFPGLNYKDNFEWQEIVRMKQINDAIAAGDQNEIGRMIALIQRDPKNYRIISPENKKSHPEFQKEAAKVYSESLRARLQRLKGISKQHDAYQKEYTDFLESYKEIPPEVKKHLAAEIELEVIEFHKNLFMEDPTFWGEFGPDVKKMISFNDQIAAWQNYIEQDPYRYNNALIPKDVRERMPKDRIASEFMNLLRTSSDHYDHISEDIRVFLPQEEVKQILVSDFQKYPLAQDKNGYPTLRRVEGLLSDDEIVTIYREAIKANPQLFSYLPARYRTLVYQGSSSSSGVLRQQRDKVLKQPHVMGTLPPEVQQGLMEAFGPEITQVFVGLRTRFGANLDAFWRSIPDIVKPSLPPEVRTQIIQYYQSYVDRNPSMINKVPQDLQGEIRTAGNWFSRLIKIAETMQGFKTVAFDPVTKQAYSLYGGKGMPVDITIGSWVEENNPAGFFLGSSKQFCLDYYSGMCDDPELLLTYQFDTNDALGGVPSCIGTCDTEIRVSRAQLVGVEEIQKDADGMVMGVIPLRRKRYGLV
jgi:hypothetical protein